MCTLVAFHRVRADYSLVVAANRDESYARRAAPPSVWSGDPAILAGTDLEKGGTWTGVSARGVYVGLTNQRAEAPPDPTRRSRGEVVVGVLRAADLDAAIAYVSMLDATHYNPFNLLIGDGERLYVAYVHERVETHELVPGIWVLVNDRLDTHQFPKMAHARALAEPLVPLAWPAFVNALPSLLADRAPPPPELLATITLPPWLPDQAKPALAALCVHTPDYGTCSTTLIALQPQHVERFYYSDGPLCRATLVDQAPLLQTLTRVIP